MPIKSLTYGRGVKVSAHWAHANGIPCVWWWWLYLRFRTIVLPHPTSGSSSWQIQLPWRSRYVLCTSPLEWWYAGISPHPIPDVGSLLVQHFCKSVNSLKSLLWENSECSFVSQNIKIVLHLQCVLFGQLAFGDVVKVKVHIHFPNDCKMLTISWNYCCHKKWRLYCNHINLCLNSWV